MEDILLRLRQQTYNQKERGNKEKKNVLYQTSNHVFLAELICKVCVKSLKLLMETHWLVTHQEVSSVRDLLYSLNNR